MSARVNRRRISPARGTSLESKADWYLAQGRLTFVLVGDHSVEGVCEGRTGTYNLGYEAGKGWWCSCSHDPCAHLVAAMKVAKPRHPAGRRVPAIDFVLGR